VVISNFWPRYESRFFELGLLGSAKRAEQYYPNDDSVLNVGSQVNWHLYVHNHMGSYQNVIVRVKLLNSTMELPNDREHKPSPFSFFVEFPLSLSINETLLVPFSWSILEAISQNDSIIIKRLILNDQVFEVHVPASSDSFFRMVFELWVYDQASQEFTFAWGSEEDFSTSLHMAFRLILPTV